MPTINTITGQLARINSAANTIWNKASEMALKLPAGDYWDLISKSDKGIYGNSNKITGTNSPEAVYVINSSGATDTYNFGIDAVAAALNAINIKDYLETNKDDTYLSGNLAINAGAVIKIPVGYNKTPFTITANSLGSQLQSTTAAAKYLYTGKTAYIKNAGNPELITGTLNTVYLYGSNDIYNANKVKNGYLKVSLNSAATSEYLNTNIYYRNPETNGVATIGADTRDSKTYLKVNLLKGYYDKDIATDIAYISGTLYRTVEISRYTTPDNETTDVVNTLQIPAGYYEGGLVITPVFKDLGDKEESILNITNLLLANNAILNFTSGSVIIDPRNYNGGSYDYFGYVSIPEAGVSTENGLFKVTASGWINKNKEYGAAYKTLTSNQVNVSDDWDTTNKVITDRIFTIKVNLGYYSATEVTKEFTIKAGSHNLSVNFYNDNKFGGSTAITSGIENITKQYGKITDTIVAGWINGSSSNKYYRIQDWVRKGSTANTPEYYTVGAAGWINANSYVGSSIYTPAAATFNPVNAASKLTIPAGAVLSSAITVNPVTAGTATYKIGSLDLQDADSRIDISASLDTDGKVDTYMSSITIDMTLILQELQKI